MKTTTMTLIAVLAMSVALFAFTPKFGGEGFEVYVDNKLMMQQYGGDMEQVKTLQLNESNYNSTITVKYYHCGKPATNRVVSVRDEQGMVVRQWKYADVNAALPALNWPVKDIINLNENKSHSYALYYSSSELTKGRMIANLKIKNGSKSLTK